MPSQWPLMDSASNPEGEPGLARKGIDHGVVVRGVVDVAIEVKFETAPRSNQIMRPNLFR